MFLTVFYQMLALAILIAVGAWMYKTDRLDDHTTTKISVLITHVFNPMLMLSSAIDSIGSVDQKSWFTLFGIVLIIFMVLIVLSFPVLPLFEKRSGQKELFQLMLIFGNLGFMGIPIVKGVFGAEYTVYVLAFVIGWNICFYTFGLVLINRRFDLSALKGMINPGTVGCVIAIVLVITEPELPSFVSAPVKYLGDVCSPLAMLVVGVSVAKSDLKKIFTTPKMYLFTAYRMILLPLLAIPVLRMLPLSDIIRGICLVEISMPIANLVLAVGLEKKLDTTDCSTGIIMTTLLSVITLPIIITLL